MGAFLRVREVEGERVWVDGVDAEVGDLCGLKRLPVLAEDFQQGLGSYDVGFGEGGRSVYGAVYVAFGGKVHNGVWLVLCQYTV